MPRLRVRRVVDGPPGAVWHHLANIADHVTWMADAVAIRFTGDRYRGVGTTFECETRLGPLRTNDRMEITEWAPGEAMGVRHRGLVRGTGRFTLRPAAGGGTELTWDEDLRFPWWLGGPVTARLAGPVLRRAWAGNLRRLAARVEGEKPGR